MASVNRRRFLRAGGLGLAAMAASGCLSRLSEAADAPASGGAAPGPQRRNILFILSDDHRWDFMSFMPQAPAFLETPNMDRMAREGAHIANAFVSTSLCSPSRATVLTGQYMHHHRVVDNQRPVPPGTVFFPQYLQKAGYQTAFIGKWHMGHDDDSPRPGFDHWVSFKGQGTYFDPLLNINGARKTFKGYTTDILTDQALDWLMHGRDPAKPFYLHLAHKAVHYPFQPADRHRGRYAKAEVRRPETMANTERNYQTQPHWVRERRYSIHGVDHMETGQYDHDPVPSFDPRPDAGVRAGPHRAWHARGADGAEHRRGAHRDGGGRRAGSPVGENGRPVVPAAADGQERALARPHLVRVPLGMELPGYPDAVRYSYEPL